MPAEEDNIVYFAFPLGLIVYKNYGKKERIQVMRGTLESGTTTLEFDVHYFVDLKRNHKSYKRKTILNDLY